MIIPYPIFIEKEPSVNVPLSIDAAIKMMMGRKRLIIFPRIESSSSEKYCSEFGGQSKPPSCTRLFAAFKAPTSGSFPIAARNATNNIIIEMKLNGID